MCDFRFINQVFTQLAFITVSPLVTTMLVGLPWSLPAGGCAIAAHDPPVRWHAPYLTRSSLLKGVCVGDCDDLGGCSPTVPPPSELMGGVSYSSSHRHLPHFGFTETVFTEPEV